MLRCSNSRRVQHGIGTLQLADARRDVTRVYQAQQSASEHFTCGSARIGEARGAAWAAVRRTQAPQSRTSRSQTCCSGSGERKAALTPQRILLCCRSGAVECCGAARAAARVARARAVIQPLLPAASTLAHSSKLAVATGASLQQPVGLPQQQRQQQRRQQQRVSRHGRRGQF